MAKKKRSTISTVEAVARLDSMMPLIRENVERALCIEATLEAGNKIVGAMADRDIPGAGAYNVIKSSLSYDLALHLARLFEALPVRRLDKNTGKMKRVGKHPNERSEATIPLMILLIRQKRCRKALTERARNFHPTHDDWSKSLYATDCEKAIEQAIDEYASVFRGKFGRSGLRELKRMRNTSIAHTDMNAAAGKVIYYQLFRLMDDARKIVEVANVAVAGFNPDLQRKERNFADEAGKFWERALLGTTREGVLDCKGSANRRRNN